MFKTNLKLALRNLTKNRGFSLINIFGLSAGMAIAIIIGLWLHDELTFDNMHSTREQFVQFRLKYLINGKHDVGSAMCIPIKDVLKNEHADDFTDLSLASWNGTKLLTVGDKKITRRGMSVEPQFLRMLDVELVQGSRERALQEMYSIVINESLAEVLFGESDPIGQNIKIDNRRDYVVTGIMPDFPKNSSWETVSLFVPWAAFAQQEWIKSATTSWDDHSQQLFGLMPPSADLASVNARIKDAESRNIELPLEPDLFVHQLSKWHLYSKFRNGENAGGRIQFVWLFGIIGVFVLLLACINFMNLSTAQSERRAKEVGVRKTVGSGRNELIVQFLTESYVVVVIATIFAIGLTYIGLPIFNEITDKEMSILWSSPLFWLAIAAFMTITGLLAGSYPAFFLSSFEPLKVLKSTFGTGRSASTPRKVLVVLQFTVSIALIIGTVVVYQQINHAKSRVLGYDKDNVIQINMLTKEIRDKFDVLRDKLLKTGNIVEVGHSNSPMTNIWSNTGGMKWKESTDDDRMKSFANTGVSHEYGKTINWEIVDGRDFSRAFKTDTAAMILNQTAVNLMGLENPVGETVTDFNGNPFTIIGVVKDILQDSPYLPVKASIYRLDEWRKNMLFIKLKAGQDIQQALTQVGDIYKSVAPATPFEYDFVDDDFGKKFMEEERIGKAASIFAILAILISCLGLFGLSAYVAERRTKEIGIRKVLGASVLDLWAMLSKDFIFLVLAACIVAIPLAWYYLSGWLDGYEYRVDLNWWVFAAAGIMAVVITLATVSFQSIKAAIASPINSLKDE
ncbi:MAG: ABC transporter permease [Saprospiraceae bacterium]